MTGVPPTAAGIVSRALHLCEHNITIQHLDDGTPEADEATLHWDAARRQVLQDVTWHFALEVIRLDTVLTDAIPQREGDLVYQLPSHVLRVIRTADTCGQNWRILGKTNQLHTPYEAPLTIEATVDVTEPAYFEPDFVTALEYLLAHRLAPRWSRSANRAEIIRRWYDKHIEMCRGREGFEGGDHFTDRAAETDWRNAVMWPGGYGYQIYPHTGPAD